MSLRAIGSGGSLTAAHALAQLHQHVTRQVGVVATPLDVTEPSAAPLSNWLLSAGGSNVDILGAARRLARQEPRQLAILCGRSDSPLADLGRMHPFIDLLLYPPPAGKDGFLATNSLLGFISVVARAYLLELGREEEWEFVRASVAPLVNEEAAEIDAWSASTEPLWPRGTTLVLHDAESRVGAIDLESKFTEAAVGNLQIADYRNFAHGRHHWLAKRGDDSAVLALFSPSGAALADRTLDLLPKDIPVARLALPEPPIATMLGSLIAALRITGWAGRARGIDPGRPGVPEFGRKLYHLPLPPAAQDPVAGLSARHAAAIWRKAGVAASGLDRSGDLLRWRGALENFRQRLLNGVFHAIALDYDGTLVDTRHRFDAVTLEISGQLRRLLEAGIILAIATGRGASVRRDLQAALPKALWSSVIVGYYNGAELAALGEDNAPDGREKTCAELAALALALRNQPELAVAAVQSDRKYQITLEARPGLSEARLWDLAHEVLLAQDFRDLIVTRSSHSIDIVPAQVSKANVLAEIRKRIGAGAILAMGDRGRWPGNDYALLREPFALSVDEISVDPETCWNLGQPGQRGIQVALEYLEALQPCAGGVRFKPDALS
ncbi:HAD hydrolase family protein [Mesorhizobium sp.]|uniref:HAD hydrolase family protein n=1 Tax=Mesorhizobium sp. TaxID=1871066 RepID=UPI0025FA2F92|nr:HAD hydrolase family protein [Mesorhizobium sp.]